jgi:hypothetical protein
MMVYLRFVVSRGLRASHRWPKISKMVNLPPEPPGLIKGHGSDLNLRPEENRH